MFGAEPKEPSSKRLHARAEGVDLHSSTAFEAVERVALERFCRYALRRPIASGRLTQGPRDLLTYRFKYVLSPIFMANKHTARQCSKMRRLPYLQSHVPETRPVT